MKKMDIALATAGLVLSTISACVSSDGHYKTAAALVTVAIAAMVAFVARVSTADNEQ